MKLNQCYNANMNEEHPPRASWLGCTIRLIAALMAVAVLLVSLSYLIGTRHEFRVVPSVAAELEGAVTRTYQWSYGRYDWTWDVAIPKELYDFYKAKNRPSGPNYSICVLDQEDDAYLEKLVDKLEQAAGEVGYDKWDTANFVARFVQNLPHTEDLATTGHSEYPRYPVETLVDGGDCEDTSILTAAVLDEMGYGVALLLLEDHIAVGIEGDEHIHGWYYEHNGKKYFYLETTGKGWKVGDIPDENKEDGVHIYSIVP